MAIIMFISSTLRCGFNISFTGTSLNSCKLFPSSSPKETQSSTSCPTAFTVFNFCMCERRRWRDTYVLYNYQIEMHAKTFHAPFRMYTNNTAKGCMLVPHLVSPGNTTGLSRHQLCEPLTLSDLAVYTAGAGPSFGSVWCMSCEWWGILLWGKHLRGNPP